MDIRSRTINKMPATRQDDQVASGQEIKAYNPAAEQPAPVSTPPSEQDYRQSLQRLERFTAWMDSQYRIPGTSIKFGWDVLIGFVPILGDLIALALSGYVLLEARKIGAPAMVIRKMLRNIAVDFVGGLAPVVGDVFDIYFRSCTRNLVLLKDYIHAQLDPPKADTGFPWLWFALAAAASVFFVIYWLSTPAS